MVIEKPDGKISVGKCRRSWRAILKLCVRAQIGSFWLEVGSSGELLWIDNKLSFSIRAGHKLSSISFWRRTLRHIIRHSASDDRPFQFFVTGLIALKLLGELGLNLALNTHTEICRTNLMLDRTGLGFVKSKFNNFKGNAPYYQNKLYLKIRTR
jgi:hypothetical protein